MGSAGWQLPHNRAQAGAAYQVSVHLAAVPAGLPGSRNAPGRPVTGQEHLISAMRRLSAQRTPVK
jgi:hypothetical protein